MLFFRISFFIFLCCLCACEKVPKDFQDRWSLVKENSLPLSQRRTILVEEYTGQDCINCGTIGEQLNQLSRSYQPNLIAVSIHNPENPLVNKALSYNKASFYRSTFNLPTTFLPFFLVNRTQFPENGDKYYTPNFFVLPQTIRKLIHTPTLFHLDLTPTLIADSLFIETQIKALTSVQDSLGFQLWLVEDIPAYQQFPTKADSMIIHHNVLRACLNGIMGESFLIKQKTLTLNHHFKLPTIIQDRNKAKVVGFIYNKRHQSIEQAVIKPFIIHQ